MVKFLKYGLLLVVLLIVAVFGFLLTLDVNDYKPDLIQAVKDNTGREFQINGELKLAVSLIPTIAVNDVTFGNADWGSQPDMLKVGRFEAQVSLLPLLHGHIRIVRIVLVQPDLFLETNAVGTGNWALQLKDTRAAGAPQAEGDGRTRPAFAVREVNVEDAILTYLNGQTGKAFSMAIPKLTLLSETDTSPVNINLDAHYQKLDFTLNATVGPLQQLVAGDPYPVDLTLTAADVKIQATGSINQVTQLTGLDLNITAAAEKLSNLGKLTGTELPETGPVNVNGKLMDTADGYQFRSLMLAIAEHRVAGDMELGLSGDRPRVTAQLTSPLIDLRPYSRTDAPPRPRVFSNTPLPADALKAIDAELKMTVQELFMSSAELTDVDLTVQITDGQLKISPFKSGIAGGRLQLDAALTPRGEALELKTDLSVKQMIPGQLPKLRDRHLLDDGITDITFKGSGTGNSVAAIMAGWNGNLQVTVGKGVLQNSSLDLAGADLISSTLSMVNPFSKKENTTELQCAVVRFDIKDGIAATEKGIALETSKMTVVGGGTINLKTEELDLGARPHPRQGIGIGAGQLAEVVRLGGTLAEPKTRTDTVAAMKTAATVGAAVATGGLSLLAGGLFDRTTADEHPCATALGAESTTAAAKTDTTQPAAQTTAEPKPNVIESTGEKVKGVLKGLFGK